MVLCIALGFAIARKGWVRASTVPDLANIVFLVLTPALLFRTMAQVRLQELDFAPVALYFAAAALLFGGTLALQGWNSTAAARALAHTFSNTVMIGVPFIGLVYGESGLVVLFTLVSLHSLVLLTAATLVFELVLAPTVDALGTAPRARWRTLARAVKSSILHPVPLPILIGLGWGQTGWPVPAVLDRALGMLGSAVGPTALLLVGITLAYTRIGRHWRGALRIAGVKNLAMPLLVGAIAWALGLSGQAVAVMCTTAAMPVGANVLLFTQRYGVMQDEVSSAIAISTALALVTLPLALLVAQGLAAR